MPTIGVLCSHTWENHVQYNEVKYSEENENDTLWSVLKKVEPNIKYSRDSVQIGDNIVTDWKLPVSTCKAYGNVVLIHKAEPKTEEGTVADVQFRTTCNYNEVFRSKVAFFMNKMDH